MTQISTGGTASISIRLDRELKEEAEQLFSELGMNMTTAINVFLRQCVREYRIPFEVRLNHPNAETIAAIEEIEAMQRGEIPKRIMSVEEYFKDL